MKKTFLLLTIFSLLLFFTKESVCYENEPDGFFGLKWGSDIGELTSKYNKVSMIKDKGDIKWYIANSGYAKFSGVIAYLSYEYFEDKLILVNIFFDDGREETLEKALTVSYGEPTRKRDNITKWTGEVTNIELDYGKNALSIYNKEMLFKATAYDIEMEKQKWRK